MLSFKKALQALLWLIYPLIIFFGLQVFEPRQVALLLGATLLLRRWHNAGRLLAGLTRIDLFIVGMLLSWSVFTMTTNSEILLRLYPAAVNLGMLLLFGFSLQFPPSMIERFARLHEPELSADGVRYTRRLTLVWCAFFVVNGALATWTALCASRETWALYNGLIAYVLIGALLVAERVFRRWRRCY